MSWISASMVRNLACLLLVGGILVLAAAGRASATVITAAPVNFGAAEGALFNGSVATFTDNNPAAAPSDFTTVIDWGDGSPPTAGTISASLAGFVASGQHTYADEGSFTVTVTIADQPPGTGIAGVTDTATITERDALSGSPFVITCPAGSPFTGTIASFSDSDNTSPVSDFNATINWGDATTTAGTVSGGAGAFLVSGTHTYAATGTYFVVATLSDNAPGTATAQVTSSAQIGNGPCVSAVPAPPAPIPALGDWGRAMLITMCLGAGLLLLRRR